MKTLVISDQPLTVIALQSVLRRVAPQAELYDATHLGEAMQLLTEDGPFDLLVLDLDTHGVKRVSGAALLRQMWPAMPTALIADMEHDEDVTRSVDIGATAYVLKSDPTDKLSAALSGALATRSRQPEPALAAG